MDNNELILDLIISLKPNCATSQQSPWLEDLMKSAEVITKLTTPAICELVCYVQALTPRNNFDTRCAESFCLIPKSNKEWKVYVLDRDNKILTQLENYSGEIVDDKDKPIHTPFKIKI